MHPIGLPCPAALGLTLFVAAATYGDRPPTRAIDAPSAANPDASAPTPPHLAPDLPTPTTAHVDHRPPDTRLADAVTFSLAYTADLFYNTRGGINTNSAEQYRGLLGVDMTLDTTALGLWDGGTFFLSAFENHGTDITQRHVGDLQALNNADAPNDQRLYEYWYQHAIPNQRITLKIGKIDANNDFDAGLFRDEFIHSSPGFSPTIPMPTWPDPALGLVLIVEPLKPLYLHAGIFDARGSAARSGFRTAFHSPDESFAILEFGFRPLLDMGNQPGLPGQYALGVWHHSGTWPVIGDDRQGRTRTESANSGFYVSADQMLFRESCDDCESDQGLGLFFQFGWAASDRNEITQHYGGGFQYYGPVPDRDNDILGLGVHHVSLSGRVQSLEQRYGETAIEMFYKAQLTTWLSIKPDVQYIVNPGGSARDALLFGLRVECSF